MPAAIRYRAIYAARRQRARRRDDAIAMPFTAAARMMTAYN